MCQNIAIPAVRLPPPSLPRPAATVLLSVGLIDRRARARGDHRAMQSGYGARQNAAEGGGEFMDDDHVLPSPLLSVLRKAQMTGLITIMRGTGEAA